MKAVFSTRFKADLTEAEARYREISERLASELRERVARFGFSVSSTNGVPPIS